MTYQENPADVIMRAKHRVDATTAWHLQVKSAMEKCKDQLLDQLQDPTLTPAQRQQLEQAKEQVKADIAAIRVGGRDSDYRSMWERYRPR